MTDSEARALSEEMARYIFDHIKQGFAETHLSGNLMDTMRMERISKDEVRITIPAERYDLGAFFEEGVVIPTGDGSYADQVNYTGGFSHKHIGYAGKAVWGAVSEVALPKIKAGGDTPETKSQWSYD